MCLTLHSVVDRTGNGKGEKKLFAFNYPTYALSSDRLKNHEIENSPELSLGCSALPTPRSFFYVCLTWRRDENSRLHFSVVYRQVVDGRAEYWQIFGMISLASFSLRSNGVTLERLL
jgi:hypothetical protein